MSLKVHLLDSAEPLQEGTDLVALCGAGVPKAAFALMWDEEALGDWLFPTRSICRDCRELWVNDQKEQRYWYGILPGQEATPPQEL